MSLGSFIKKQFIDILQWNEDSDGVLAYRYPMADFEIQYGASLTVRESQAAVFINEGQVADVFGAGMYKLSTQTLPVLTYLKNWDKLFESPFKSDVYFFSTRLQLGRKWGTPQPITIRDADFGMVRMRAFGVYSYKLVDPKLFFSEISGTREVYTRDDLELQLRNLVVSTMTSVLGGSGVPFLDMAGNQGLMGQKINEALVPVFAKYGLELDNFAVENISLPEELQKAIDTRISMGMIGNMQTYTQYQAANAIPLAAQNEGGLAGIGAGMAAGVGVGQAMANAMNTAINPGAMTNALGLGGAAAPVGAGVVMGADGGMGVGVMAGAVQQPIPTQAVPADPNSPQAKLGQLKGLLDQGLISQADYDSAKAEVLKKLIG
ncbi:SPFH domain-containing protein [Chitinibacter bivalviorum]|uniref:SPFH domain-containing protein n=1 Tax=Chitinibacter bivalviorum TaxID=2739434 RepID=A0A7H9BHP8_9NEIS|nr:SPFH domain-containing protein [Chitinibacter bivalviorum]QLG88145.1 SPFH domain-containing protein [Chitinibacter bivalviorum]